MATIVTPEVIVFTEPVRGDANNTPLSGVNGVANKPHKTIHNNMVAVNDELIAHKAQNFADGTPLHGVSASAAELNRLDNALTDERILYYDSGSSKIESCSSAAATNASLTELTNGSNTTLHGHTSAGNAATTTIQDNNTINAEYYPTWVTSSAGSNSQWVSSSKLKWNPATGTLTATTFNGNATNADTVDSIHASATPTPNYLLPLNGSGLLPADITGTAANATNVTTNINGNAISTIFETNGTTVKNATNSSTLFYSGSYRSATHSNVINTIVARNGAGDFNANVITAVSFSGALSGNATTATNAANATNADSSTIAITGPGAKIATFVTPGDGQPWSKPAGITSIIVMCVGGGGGGGGGGTGGTLGGGGGGAGGYILAQKTLPSAASTYYINVGAGGSAGTTTANGGTGGDSSFLDGATPFVTGYGGVGGKSGGGGGGIGGGASGNVGGTYTQLIKGCYSAPGGAAKTPGEYGYWGTKRVLAFEGGVGGDFGGAVGGAGAGLVSGGGGGDSAVSGTDDGGGGGSSYVGKGGNGGIAATSAGSAGTGFGCGGGGGGRLYGGGAGIHGIVLIYY